MLFLGGVRYDVHGEGGNGEKEGLVRCSKARTEN